MCASQVLLDDVLCAVAVFIDRYSISYMSNQVRLLFFDLNPCLVSCAWRIFEQRSS